MDKGRPRLPSYLVGLLCMFVLALGLTGPEVCRGHEGHRDRTYEIRAAAEPTAGTRFVELDIREAGKGKRVAARFSLEVDGESWAPDALSAGGIHFTSIHARKKQRQVVLFSRGNDKVRFALPEGAGALTVHAVRGYQYRPQSKQVDIPSGLEKIEVTVSLSRFTRLGEAGWHAGDEHLHYERRDPRHDADWLAMMEADGLSHGFFMVLKGGNFDDVWAQQYAYGEAGSGRGDERLLITGEEFRGSMQGHNNLLGHSALLEPISVGGMGRPPHPYQSPSTHEMLVRTRELGGIGGPAHGGTFGQASTAVMDALNGASEFFELANTHLLELAPWYRVLNCGTILAPVAGTDLPNFPFRDFWQPFFGETRTYVNVENASDFSEWKSAVRNGRVFISSGPLLEKITVNGEGLGSVVELPKEGGGVVVKAVLASALPLSRMEVIINGQPVDWIEKQLTSDEGAYRWELHHELDISESCWIAVRAFGPRKERLFSEGKILQRSMLHSAAIPVLVGGRPVRVESSIQEAEEELQRFREHYRSKGSFPDEETRAKMLELFDRASMKLGREKTVR